MAAATTHTEASCDIAIVGGGMVGASLAGLLAAAQPDWQIVLIEALPMPEPGQAPYQPSFDARSSALSEGSVSLLTQLGLWQTLREHATAIAAVHVSDRGHLGGSLMTAQEQGVPALGYVLENAWLGRVLLAHLRSQVNIRCLAPARVAELKARRGGYQLVVETTSESISLNCKLAVIADGGDSPLRRRLGIQAQVSDYAQTAIITNVSFSQAHKGVAYERFTAEGPLALLPLGESAYARTAAMVWSLPQARAAEVMALSEAGFLSELQRSFGHRLGRFEQLGQRYAYPLQLIHACEQVRSHLVLVGNAAHFLHPVAGQGFNLALRDCGALVETLVRAERQGRPLGELAVLADYQRQQAQDQALTTAFSDHLVRFFSSDALTLASLRHLGLLGLELVPALKQGFSATAMGRGGRRADWQLRPGN